jgi:hypothetical protein
MTQLSSQLDPAPARRSTGLGAAPISLANGVSATVYAQKNTLLQVAIQGAAGNPVTTTINGGASTYVGGCPDPCQFIMDGTVGTISFSWGPLTGLQSAIVHVVAAPPPLTSLPGRSMVPVYGRGSTGVMTGGTFTAPAPATPSPTSTGTKVAAVAGVSIVTVAVVAALAGWSVNKSLDHLWSKIRGKNRTK